ncbi:MAG TPA: hypothetical protein VKK61_09380, partial [Tepidisphaeraceae bacterium]|nr:hypothetical protein [Tepidisphaeraceae bacterium]
MTKQNPARSASSAVAIMPNQTRGRKSILVVDDEKDLVDLITYNLQRNGFDIHAAYNGNEA